MRSLLLLLSFFLFTQGLFSQASETENRQDRMRRHKIYLTLGRTSATGDFGNTGLGDNGYATSGAELSLGYEYRVDGNLGLVFKYSGFAYQMDADQLAQDLANEVSRGLMGEPVSVITELDPYAVGGFLFGPRLYAPVGVKVNLFAEVLLGYMAFLSPEARITTTTNSTTIVTNRSESEPSGAFGYNLSGGLNITLGRVVNLDLMLGYVAANFTEIEQVITTTSFGQPGVSTIISEFDQKYSAFNMGIQLGFNF